MTTRVVDFRKEPCDEYIGRESKRYGKKASKWANPFVIGTDGTREEVIAKHEKWFMSDENEHLRKQLPELKDKILGCYCKPKSCHGDLYVRLLEGS